MNIDKVNATLGKALVHIQYGEADDLRAAMESGDDDSGDFVSEYVELLIGKVVEAAGAEESVAAKAVIESMEALADKHPIKVKSTDDLAAWAKKVELADEIARRLS